VECKDLEEDGISYPLFELQDKSQEYDKVQLMDDDEIEISISYAEEKSNNNIF
jgi:hypothetical protein